MKKFVPLLLIFGLCSLASAGTMEITGLPECPDCTDNCIDTSNGPVVLFFDIISNGQLDDDAMFVYCTTGGTLGIAGAVNNVVPGEIYDDDPLNHDSLGAYVDVTDVANPVIWADIATV